MKILIIHNSYQYRGGEDEVVASEKALLENHGHQVIYFHKNNSNVKQLSFLRKIIFVLKDIYWSKSTYNELKRIIEQEKPDVAHFHNILFMISPSAYQACFDSNLPIVQTLHNYRYICPIGTFYRNDNICEECISQGTQMAVLNKCWKNSYASSYILTKILVFIKRLKIFENKINCFIALSDFSKNKFIDSGLSREKIFVKPNFVANEISQRQNYENYAIYVGTLQPYKGIMTLVNTWKEMKNDIKLKIVGDGPLLKDIIAAANDYKNIEVVGRVTIEDILRLMSKACFLVIPTECYENFPRAVVEAFSCGVPVIASDIGALREIVQDKVNGLLFKPQNKEDLSTKVNYLIENPKERNKMAENALMEYKAKYTPEKNYETLINIYSQVIQSCLIKKGSN